MALFFSAITIRQTITVSYKRTPQHMLSCYLSNISHDHQNTGLPPVNYEAAVNYDSLKKKY